MNNLEIRQTIQSAGNEFFEKMYATNFELCNISGEFMSLNESYVLLHQDLHETFKTREILKTGFSINQKKFLNRLKQQMEAD